MIGNIIDSVQNVSIGGLSSKMYQHITDDNIHLSIADREKLDAINIELLQQSTNNDISDYKLLLKKKADKDDIPTKVSDLVNDLGFISNIPDYYTTEEEVKLLIKSSITDSGYDSTIIDLLQSQITELTTLVNQHSISISDIQELIKDITIGDVDPDIENQVQQLRLELDNLISRVDELLGRMDDFESTDYQLPIATNTRLGGVKVGYGLEIDGQGILSVDDSLISGNPGTPGDTTALREWVTENFLTKQSDDTTQFSLNIEDGVVIGLNTISHKSIVSEDIQSDNYSHGNPLGAGYFLGNSDGDSYLEVDRLDVRKKATFTELEIRKLSYVNGTIVLSPAGGEIIAVESVSNGWRCTLKSDDGEMSTTNSWVVQDYARCQTFDIASGTSHNVQNKYYWREVVEVGQDENGNNYVVLSNQSGNYDSGSDDPEVGDTIVCYGHDDTVDEMHERTNVIELSSTDSEEAPCIRMYSNINTFNLSNATLSSVISPDRVQFISNLFRLTSGGSEYPIAVDRGEWTSTAYYNYWDRVSHNGSLYLCVNKNGSHGTTSPEGMEPGSDSSEDYWLLQVSKGDPGQDGEDGQDGQDGDTSGVYQIQLSDNVIFTQYDSETRSYNPDVTDRDVIVHVYKGTSDQDPLSYELSAKSDNEKLLVWANSADGNIQITSCTLVGGESAKVTVTVVIDEVTLRSAFTVICSSTPITEDTYTVLIEPTEVKLDFDVQTDISDGLITGVVADPDSNLNSANIRVFRGSNEMYITSDPPSNDEQVQVTFTTDNLGTWSINTDPEALGGTSISCNDLTESSTQINPDMCHQQATYYFPVSFSDATLHFTLRNGIEIPDRVIRCTSQFQVAKSNFEFDDVHMRMHFMNGNGEYINFSNVFWSAEQLTSTISATNALTEWKTEVDQTIKSWSVTAFYNGLAEAGIKVYLDGEEKPTGNIDIFADQVTIKSSVDGVPVLQTVDDQVYIRNCIIDQIVLDDCNVNNANILNASIKDCNIDNCIANDIDVESGTIAGFTINNTSMYFGDRYSSSVTSGLMQLSNDGIYFNRKIGGESSINTPEEYIGISFKNIQDKDGQTPYVYAYTEHDIQSELSTLSPHFYSAFRIKDSGEGIYPNNNRSCISFYASNGAIVSSGATISGGWNLCLDSGDGSATTLIDFRKGTNIILLASDGSLGSAYRFPTTDNIKQWFKLDVFNILITVVVDPLIELNGTISATTESSHTAVLRKGRNIVDNYEILWGGCYLFMLSYDGSHYNIYMISERT